MSKDNKEEGKKIFGYHLALDIYNCDKDALDSIERCYYYLDRMVDLLEMSKQSPPFVVYTDPIKYPDKAGISGWVPIVESGISIHTITPTAFASIDIYSCKKYDIEVAKKFTQEVFNPQKIEENFLLRGVEYIHPPA